MREKKKIRAKERFAGRMAVKPTRTIFPCEFAIASVVVLMTHPKNRRIKKVAFFRTHLDFSVRMEPSIGQASRWLTDCYKRKTMGTPENTAIFSPPTADSGSDFAAEILINGSSVFIARAPMLRRDLAFTGRIRIIASDERPPLAMVSSDRLSLPGWCGWSSQRSAERFRFARMVANSLFVFALDSDIAEKLLLSRDENVPAAVIDEIADDLSALSSTWSSKVFGLEAGERRFVLQSPQANRDRFFCGKNTFSDYPASAEIFGSWEEAMRATQIFGGCYDMKPMDWEDAQDAPLINESDPALMGVGAAEVPGEVRHYGEKRSDAELIARQKSSNSVKFIAVVCIPVPGRKKPLYLENWSGSEFEAHYFAPNRKMAFQGMEEQARRVVARIRKCGVPARSEVVGRIVEKE